MKINKKIVLIILIVILIMIIAILTNDEKDAFVGKWKDSVEVYEITKSNGFYEMQAEHVKYENGIVEDGLLKFKDMYGRIYAYKYKKGNLISYYYENNSNGEKNLKEIGIMERVE